MLQPAIHSAIRGRFAPTPSGSMHIGNALAALLSWLQIRSAGGVYILRIEDIDTSRSKPQFAEQILKDLRWLGLDWDEGPDRGGPYSPYVQSERLDFYEQALEKLKAKGLLYPCYCSRADIMSASSAPHGLSAEGPAYLGTCRHLSAEEKKLKAAHKQPSLRFLVPDRILSFYDGILGRVEYSAAKGGDFVVKRADGMYSYQLAVVVDDAMMAVSDVFRGADLLDSTPRQLLLYEALGLKAPRFAHFPLLVDQTGRRLAKRSRGLSLSDLQGRGIRPETVVGWLAYAVGLLDRPEALKPAELLDDFQMDRISTSPVMLTESLTKHLLC